MDLPADALSSYVDERPPWRKAAIVTAGIAAIELVALVVIALAFVARPFADDGARPAKSEAKREAATSPAAAQGEATASKLQAPAPALAELPREKTWVLVLNGNGVSGAASSAAQRVKTHHYRVAGIGDAARRDFPRTIVMYRPGFRGEAQRLARDLDLGLSRAVPLDGMRAADFGSARLALVIGG